MSLTRRAARRDENEPLLVEFLRRSGCIVRLLSAPDLPDLLVGYQGRWVLLEVKMPDGRLKPGQELFLNACQVMGLPAEVVRSVEDCRNLLRRLRRRPSASPPS